MPDEAIAVGLMSGTSTDGVDAAVVRFGGPADAPTLTVLGFVSVPYEPEVRERLLALAAGAGGAPELARMGVRLGELFAQAAQEALAAAGVPLAEVAVVGSHGHTVAHLPGQAATLQIGEAAVIAERLGLVTVSDFRVRDVAAGGQGAPLVPYFDYRFLTSPQTGRVLLNLGGIANVTVLPRGAGLEEVIAFDTGPGNMPIDGAVSLLLPGAGGYDQGGELARSGRADEGLLAELLRHEYFGRRPPKSCGREEFGAQFVRRALGTLAIEPRDAVATFTELTARTISDATAPYTAEGAWEIVASGGGARNTYLLERLAALTGLPLLRAEALGVPDDAKEAIAFAFLALETLRGRPANVPTATGARGPRVLGKITPA